MKFGSNPFDRRRSPGHHDQRRIEFRQLRDKRWNKFAIWRYLILLAIVILLLRYLFSVASSP